MPSGVGSVTTLLLLHSGSAVSHPQLLGDARHPPSVEAHVQATPNSPTNYGDGLLS